MAPARTIDLPVTGEEVRRLCRTNDWKTPTSGIAPSYLQANLIILPSRFARDFTLLCTRNPVPCPLLASSAAPGDYRNFISHIPSVSDKEIAAGIDIRTDAPRYNIYIDGELREQVIPTIKQQWDANDHMAFLIGCSFSFENALISAGLPPPHILHGRNVPMYRTKIPLCASGAFSGSTYTVSMRMYHTSEVETVRDVTRPYVTTHGEPVAWGWEGMRAIGIDAVNQVDWGEAPVTSDGLEIVQDEEEAKVDGLVPVLWGCGVTPQEAVMRAKIPGTVMGHAPGHMVVLDGEATPMSNLVN